MVGRIKFLTLANSLLDAALKGSSKLGHSQVAGIAAILYETHTESAHDLEAP